MNPSNYSFMFQLFDFDLYRYIDSAFVKSIIHFLRTYNLLKGLMNIKEMNCHASYLNQGCIDDGYLNYPSQYYITSNLVPTFS